MANELMFPLCVDSELILLTLRVTSRDLSHLKVSSSYVGGLGKIGAGMLRITYTVE